MSSGKKEIELSIEYTPYKWQQKFHNGFAKKRYGLCICSRQHGKTELVVAEILHHAITGPVGAGYALFAPHQNQARRIFWPRLKKLLTPLKQYIDFRETDLVLTLPNQARIHVLGADNENARGMSFRTVVIDEYDQIRQDVYEQVILPTQVSYGDEARLLLIGTLSGANSRLWNMYQDHNKDKDWYCQVTKATEAGVMSVDQIEMFRRAMSEYAFALEFLCDPSAPVSAAVLGRLIHRAELEGRVTDVPYNARGDVYVALDLGISDSTVATCWQFAGRSCNIIAIHEFSGIGLVEALKRLRSLHRAWDDSWAKIILPHDAAVRDMGSGVSRVEQIDRMEMFRERAEVLKATPIADGLEASRLNLERC